jgi:hypothetical protein
MMVLHINRLSGHLVTLQMPVISTLGDLKQQTLNYLRRSLNEFVFDVAESIRIRFMLQISSPEKDANGFKELENESALLTDLGVTESAELSLIIQKLARFDLVNSFDSFIDLRFF